MSVTVSGLSGLTNAYTSVLSATGSLEISGASRCDDIHIPHRVEWADGASYPAARAIRAARSVSRSRVWLVPENTSMSPDLASRTCTTIGPAWSSGLAGADGWLAAARAGLAADPMAVTARPAAPAAAAPRSIERRDTRRDSAGAAVRSAGSGAES